MLNTAKAGVKAGKEGRAVTGPGWQTIRMNISRRPLPRAQTDREARPERSQPADLRCPQRPLPGGNEGGPLALQSRSDRDHCRPGYVVNGQHRLVAAEAVNWSKVDEIPHSLVVWGVEKKTALAPAPVHRTLW